MATGNEVVLGWPAERYEEVAKELGIVLPVSSDDWEKYGDDDYWESVGKSDSLSRLLREAHFSSLVVMGFKPGLDSSDSGRFGGKYRWFETPLGNREFVVFTPELFYDPNDMEETPDVTTFGVSLSGRYFPTFLDWRDPHGTLWPVRFDAGMRRMIEVARREIESKIPFFSTADIVVIERHY